MDRWLSRGPLLHSPALLNASRSAALSDSTKSSRTRAAFTRTLPFSGAKYLQQRFSRSAGGGSYSTRAALFQERPFAADKEQLWAASAAAVTVCKRRQPDPSTSGEETGGARSANDDLAAPRSAAEKNQCMHYASNRLHSSAAGADAAEDRPSAGRCPPPPEKTGLALKAKELLMQLRDKVAVEAAAFASGARKLRQDFRYASQLLLTPGLPLSSRQIAHIRHTSIDALRLLPFIALAVLPGGGVLMAVALKFAPWLLPSPFQQKQVASLITSPSHALTPLTPEEMQLQRRRRVQLYEGLSHGLRVAVQASEAQMIKDMQVVAAVISAANELNQASKSDSSHAVPPMLLALHTRALRDDRWLVVLPRKALLQMMTLLGLELGGWGWEQWRLPAMWCALQLRLQPILCSNMVLSVKRALAAPQVLVQFLSSLKSVAVSFHSLILSLLPLHYRSALGQPLQQTLLHVLPKGFLRFILRRRLSLISSDDRQLVAVGGPDALLSGELRAACKLRGLGAGLKIETAADDPKQMRQALHAWLALTQGGVQASLVVFTAANQQKNEVPDNGIISFLTKQKEQ